MDTIFAHRGYSADAPENTLPAFQLAIEKGCDGIELDVQLTQDGQLIVCHDQRVNRTSNGQGWIKDFTCQQLQTLDAGSWFSPSFQGIRMPTLEEVLAICHKDIQINVEIKSIPFFYQGIEAKVAAEIKRFGFEDNTIISSFDHHALASIQHLLPKVKIGVLFGDHLLSPWDYVKGTSIKAYSIHPLFTFVDEAYIQQAHQAGYKVYPYTVDDPDIYQDLKAIGTDGVFSNHPKKFQK